MAYSKGMTRFHKGDDKKYYMNKAGKYYKAGDGKMYEMTKAEMSGMDDPGKQPGDQPHINPHPDDNNDNPGDDKKGGYRKSAAITVDDFEKSLAQLEALTEGTDGVSRREELLQKAMTADLEDGEREELFKSLGGEVAVDDDPVIVDDITKSLANPGAGVQDALDISEYLEGQHDAMLKALGAVGDRLEANQEGQNRFNLVLAKAIHQSGQLIKAMSERLGVIERQPARQPKSMGANAPAGGQTLEKGFGGGAPASDPSALSKSDILDTMEEMHLQKGALAPCGEDLTLATAKYEQTNQLSKALISDIVAYRQQSNNAH